MTAPYSGRLADYLGEGLLSARPEAPNIFPGTVAMYYATDTSTLYAYDGSAWHSISGGTGMTNPMTTAGDIIVGGAAGAPGRLAKGANNTFFGINGSGVQGYYTASGGTSLPIFYFEDQGADNTGASDSTTAIQATIALCASAGGVCMSKVEDATFLIGGALQDPTGANAQLTLPVVNYVAAMPITVAIVGYKAPASVISVIGSEPLYTKGLRFKSTLTTGTGAVFGGANASNFTNVNFVMKNVTVETVANPTISGLDLRKTACVDLDGVLIDPGTIAVSSITFPTSSGSWGLRLPQNGNGACTRVGIVNVIGFYNGFDIYEHTCADQMNAWGCINPNTFNSADHASILRRVMNVHCVNGLVGPATGVHYTKIEQLNIEHAASGVFVPVADITDTASALRGELSWHTVLAGTGAVHTFLISGAINMAIRELGNPPGVRTVSGTTDSPVLTDLGGLVTYSSGSAVTVTVPLNTTLAFPLMVPITFRQVGTGKVTLAGASGVTLTSALTLGARAQYSPIGIIQTSLNNWMVYGDLG